MRQVANGRQSFSFLRENGYFYVDKTQFIRKWYKTGDEVTLITRPRRFGKTLTLDMVYTFFSMDYANRSDLFRGLKIARNKDMMALQGTKHVLFLTFADEKPTTMTGFLKMMQSKVARLYGKHEYLLKGNMLNRFEAQRFENYLDDTGDIPTAFDSDGTENKKYTSFVEYLKQSVQLLCQWIEEYDHQKVIILLDEYDTPMQSAYMNGYWTQAAGFMSAFFGKTFKSNPSMERALISGITRIGKESLFSDMNHVTVASVLTDEYTDVFGFTQQEVHKALQEHRLLQLEEDVKDWYDGFTIGSRTDIYNPWSICNLLRANDHALKPYWAQSGGMGLVDRLFRSGSQQLLQDLQALILGKPIVCEIREELVFPELDKQAAAVWTLLLFTGYVRLASVQEMPESLKQIQANQRALVFTNREMRNALELLARDWLIADQTSYLHVFLDSIDKHDAVQMKKSLQMMVDLFVSSFDVGTKPNRRGRQNQPEKYFQGLMTGLTASLLGRFDLSSNGESGDGRYDLCLEAKDTLREVHIFEFKVFDKKVDQTLKDTALRAIRQIIDKRYSAKFLAKGYTQEQIYCYGIGFHGKKVDIMTEIL